MELLQLSYFCHAAQTQNFSKTAKAFLVPPSDISQSVKRLEIELGHALFTRSANRIALNENGRLFYSEVQPALDRIHQGIQAVKGNAEAKIIRLCILVHRRTVMHAVENFQLSHPECQFITTHTAPQNIHDYDIVITDKELSSAYTKKLAVQEKIVLAYNKTSFSFEQPISANELSELPFITMNNTSSVFENAQAFCRDMGFSPRIVLQSEDPFYIRKCIELGLGVSLVPSLSWKGQFSDEVAFQEIGNYTRRSYLYCKPHARNSIAAFYELLCDIFAHLK